MIFYKFKAYAHDWVMAAHDTLLGRTSVFVNDREALEVFYLTYRDYTWCGYGCEYLDKWLLTAAACGYDVFKAKYHILSGKSPERLDFFREFPPEIRSFDCRTNRRNDRELGEYYAFLGGEIPPSLPEDRDSPFSGEELERAAKLCLRDLDSIRRIFALRQTDFEMTDHFIREFGLDAWEHTGLTKAALTAALLKANGTGTEDREYDIVIPDCAEIRRYSRIPEWYAGAGKREDNTSQMPSQYIMGSEVRFSWGGLHSAFAEHVAEGLIVSYDVTSYYPSIQLKYGFGHEVIDRWDRFEHIHRTSLMYKRAGNSAARGPYKIADNSVSGQLKNSFSSLYSPQSYNCITVCGQMLLLDLLEHLEDGTKAQLIQANTDGIYLLVLPDDLEKVREAVSEWEDRTGMETEETVTDGRMFQRDVNSYVIFDASGNVVKAKGMAADPDPLKYELAVVRRAVREYLKNGTPPEDTVSSCKRLIDFQRVVCAPPGHVALAGRPLAVSPARIFASTDTKSGSLTCFDPQHGSWQVVPRTPPHCFIVNDDITEASVPEELDRQWYIDEAKKEICNWTRVKDSKAPERHCSFSRSANRGPAVSALLELAVTRKPFGQYTEEEIAAAVLRHLASKNVDLSHLEWNSVEGGIWKARLYDPQDKPGNPSVALTIHMDKPTRARLHAFRSGSDIYWSLKKDRSMRMSASALASIPKVMMSRLSKEKREEALQNVGSARQAALDASARARSLYLGAEPLSRLSLLDPRNGPEYLRAKGELEYAREHDCSLRVVQDARGDLLVPFENSDGLVTVQRVGPGRKAFARGCPVPGSRAASHRIPGNRMDIIALCEGLATGLSVHRRYRGNVTVCVCGSCTDLAKTGLAMLRQYAATRFIVAADNDMGSRNGINHGMNAAERIHAASPERVCIDFVPDRNMDFNDARLAGVAVPVPERLRGWLSRQEI